MCKYVCVRVRACPHVHVCKAHCRSSPSFSWLPFLFSKESILQVLQRVFPFGRGVFEVCKCKESEGEEGRGRGVRMGGEGRGVRMGGGLYALWPLYHALMKVYLFHSCSRLVAGQGS